MKSVTVSKAGCIQTGSVVVYTARAVNNFVFAVIIYISYCLIMVAFSFVLLIVGISIEMPAFFQFIAG